MQSEFCTWQNSLTGQELPKMYMQCTSPGDGQTSCKAWLTSDERRRCSNEVAPSVQRRKVWLASVERRRCSNEAKT